MKLRIRGNSIRLRLAQTEVADLAAKGRVEEVTTFANGERLVYALACGAALGAKLSGGVIEVTLPSAQAKAWTTSDEVGIEGTDGELRILVEKDFKCLTERKDEDDTDAFPNPHETC